MKKDQNENKTEDLNKKDAHEELIRAIKNTPDDSNYELPIADRLTDL